MGKKSILDFAQIYFPDYITSPTCSFHKEICDILIEMADKRKRNLAVAAPRAHAKSTVVSLFYAVWSICYAKENYIVLFSATQSQAINLMSGIKGALENNEKLMNDFPEICHTGEGIDQQKWTQQEIETKNGIKVHALGCEQEARGFKSGRHRPTLVIFDDVDGDKNTYSLESRSKLLKWFKSTIRYAGSKKTNMVAVGTLLHTESLLSRFVNRNEFQNWNNKVIYRAVISDAKREDLWEKWVKIRFFQEKYKGTIAKYQFDEENLDFSAIFPKLRERNYVAEDNHVASGFDVLDEGFKGYFPDYSERQFLLLEMLLKYFREEQDGLKAADSFFNDHRELMEEGAKVLWPEEYDYYSLMKIKKIEGPYEFNREMQNDPRSLEDCYFDPEKFEYWTKKYPTEADLINDLGDELDFFGACDPSMGPKMGVNAGKRKGKDRDYSAIIVLARHRKENIFYVLKADIKVRTPEELVQDIVNCHRGRTFSGFVFETNVFQGLFIPSIRTLAAHEGVHTSIQPINSNGNKEYRIRQLGNYITPGWIRFSREHERLLEQLKDFPMSSHDDGPDALEMVLRCANQTLPGTVWGSLTSDDGSSQLKILPENVRDPNKKNYGKDYDPTDDSTGEDYYYGKDDDD